MRPPLTYFEGAILRSSRKDFNPASNALGPDGLGYGRGKMRRNHVPIPATTALSSPDCLLISPFVKLSGVQLREKNDVMRHTSGMMTPVARPLLLRYRALY